MFSTIDMTPSTPEMRKKIKTGLSKVKERTLTWHADKLNFKFFLGYRMRINLISGLVKPGEGDQALISISIILKFSAQVKFPLFSSIRFPSSSKKMNIYLTPKSLSPQCLLIKCTVILGIQIFDKLVLFWPMILSKQQDYNDKI